MFVSTSAILVFVVTLVSSQTTEDCGHQLDCDALSPGMYADPYNCRKYWDCDANLGGFHYICEENYLYDAENEYCDLPERVNCEWRPICDDCDKDCNMQTTVKPTQSPNATTTEDTSNCSDYCTYPNGDFEIGCCNNVFCKCLNGVGYTYPCQSSETVFVQSIDACDWKANVYCCNH